MILMGPRQLRFQKVVQRHSLRGQGLAMAMVSLAQSHRVTHVRWMMPDQGEACCVAC